MPTPQQLIDLAERLGLPTADLERGLGAFNERFGARDLPAPLEAAPLAPLACIRPVVVQRAVCPKCCAPPCPCDRCGHDHHHDHGHGHHGNGCTGSRRSCDCA